MNSAKQIQTLFDEVEKKQYYKIREQEANGFFQRLSDSQEKIKQIRLCLLW